MKFKELINKFENSLDLSNVNSAQIPYIKSAYKSVINKTLAEYKESETATKSKIEKLEITDHMKNKLTKLLHDKNSKTSNSKTSHFDKNAQTAKTSKSKTSQTAKTSKSKTPHFDKNAHYDKNAYYENNALQEELTKILGIGEKKAKDLLKMGLKSVADLKKKKWFDLLGTDTQMILTHKPLRAIPNEKIKKIENKLTSLGSKSADIDVILVGSYRRAKPHSRDIDIMIVSDKPDALDAYLEHLNAVFNNRVYIYSKGDDKMSVIIQPETAKKTTYKCDIFRADTETQWTMLLYSTGSKEFNIRMRVHAKRQGFLLNQNGIFRVSDGKKINKPTDTEYDLFKIIDMPYVEPKKRI